MSQEISVAIIEDDDAVRGSLLSMFERVPHIKCIGDFPAAEDALINLYGLSPSVVLVDINLPGMSGVDFVRQAVELLPQSKFVMLTVHDDTNALFNSLAAGASGYLVKPVRAAELISALEDVQMGGAPMTSHIARKVVQAFHKPTGASTPNNENLSDRERQVLNYLVEGLLYKEIASKLNVSYNTVHTYISRIYQKLQVRSRSQAVAKYLKNEPH
jgi:DNA-binding NarL/FixJ family response regulator